MSKLKVIKMSNCSILALPGYETIPSKAELETWNIEQLKSVKFSIKNKFGRIDFLEKVDLSSIDLEKVVEIASNTVEVYKDKSPPVGTGLNVRSIVTLYNVGKYLSRQQIMKNPLFEKV